MDFDSLNSKFDGRLCSCGSGDEQVAVHDSKDIFITFGCTECLEQKLKGYRHDVLYGNDYETEEQVEPI